VVVELQRPPRPIEPIEPPVPLQFKVVDIRSSQVLAEGIGARETVELLEGVASVVDVRVYVWMRLGARWRLLTLDEQKALWGFRHQTPVAAAT